VNITTTLGAAVGIPVAVFWLVLLTRWLFGVTKRQQDQGERIARLEGLTEASTPKCEPEPPGQG
jgi:hypothetical protein